MPTFRQVTDIQAQYDAGQGRFYITVTHWGRDEQEQQATWRSGRYWGTEGETDAVAWILSEVREAAFDLARNVRVVIDWW